MSQATVLLNANIAFLAIPSPLLADGTHLLPAQVASQISIVTSLTSVLIGLVFMKDHSTTQSESGKHIVSQSTSSLAKLSQDLNSRKRFCVPGEAKPP